MSSDIQYRPLNEVAQLSSGKRPISVVKERTASHGVPVIGGGGTSGFTEHHLFTEDILITGRVGTLGKLFAPKGPCWPSDNALVIRPRDGLVHFQYLKYALGSVIQAAVGLNRGAANPLVTQTDLGRLEIPVPDKTAQKQIAMVLARLDDRVEVNHRINETLEAMAQAIFKSWFVDFEPVNAKIAAKAEGRDPLRAAMTAISGKPDAELDTLPPGQFATLATTAALFPDEMEDSELGELPQGWAYRPLSRMVNLIGGGTPKRSEASFWNGSIPWFSVKDAPADGDVFVIATEEHITEEGLRKSATRLLPEGVTIISARGTVGKLALVGTPMAMNQSCYGVQGAQGIGPHFNFFNLKTAIDTLKQNTHGAVFDTITQSTFDTVTSVCPKQEERDAFEALVTPFLRRIRDNLKETKSLAEIRDALLPKLLSGELVVHTPTSAAVLVGG